MKVLNVHERLLPVAPPAVGALLDSLSSPADRLWPAPMWPAMRFDRPLQVGAVGGHGPIRYFVESRIPGKSIVFRLTGPSGFVGCHWAEVIAVGERQTLLRHTLQMRLRGVALLTWPLAIHWFHDAVLRDLMAQAEASLGLAPQVTPWSPWVKLLRWLLSAGRMPRQIVPRPR